MADDRENEPSRYWFPAKTYGWGWGFPARREGWIVYITWTLTIIAVSPFLAGRHWLLFVVFMFAMAALLVGICWWKGEPPRWRWGA